MDTVDLMDSRIPLFMLKKIVRKMSYRTQICLKGTSIFGHDLVEMFETDDFKSHCAVKAEIFRQLQIKRQKLLQALPESNKMTLEDLQRLKKEMKAELRGMMEEFFRSFETDLVKSIRIIQEFYTKRNLIADTVDLWLELYA